LLENSFSQRKLSQIYGTVTQFATPMNMALEGQRRVFPLYRAG